MREGYSRGSCIYQNKERNRAAYPLWVYAGKERRIAMAKILMQGKERFMCPVCENEMIKLGQNYCQICGEALEWEEEGENEEINTER
jgi:hypothetical protein